jgi:hypothetical protein
MGLSGRVVGVLAAVLAASVPAVGSKAGTDPQQLGPIPENYKDLVQRALLQGGELTHARTIKNPQIAGPVGAAVQWNWPPPYKVGWEVCVKADVVFEDGVDLTGYRIAYIINNGAVVYTHIVPKFESMPCEEKPYAPWPEIAREG